MLSVLATNNLSWRKFEPFPSLLHNISPQTNFANVVSNLKYSHFTIFCRHLGSPFGGARASPQALDLMAGKSPN